MEHGRSVGAELHSLTNLLKRFTDHSRFCRWRAGTELTDMQTRIVCFLYTHREGDIFQKDIEEAFSVRRPTVSILLRTMETKGLIARESVPYDARLKKVVLTENALALAGNAATEIRYLEDILTANVDTADLEVFFKVAAQLRENIEKNLCRSDQRKEGDADD